MWILSQWNCWKKKTQRAAFLHLPQHFPGFETILLNQLCVYLLTRTHSLKTVPALLKLASPVLTPYVAQRRCSGNINSTNEQINQRKNTPWKALLLWVMSEIHRKYLKMVGRENMILCNGKRSMCILKIKKYTPFQFSQQFSIKKQKTNKQKPFQINDIAPLLQACHCVY